MPFKKGYAGQGAIDCIHFVDAVYSEFCSIPPARFCGPWKAQARELIRRHGLKDSPAVDGCLLAFESANGPHLAILIDSLAWHASPPVVGVSPMFSLGTPFACLLPSSLCLPSE